LSFAIWEKSLVRDVASTEPDGVLLPPVVPVVFVDEELLHATIPMVMPKVVATRAARFRETCTGDLLSSTDSQVRPNDSLGENFETNSSLRLSANRRRARAVAAWPHQP
jgi:hypothetical protein